MGVFEGRGNLAKGIKQLNHKWLETRSVWDDANAEDFQREHVQPLEQAVRTAAGAMDSMAQLLSQIKRECT